MTPEVEAAAKVAGLAIVFWFTGYGYGTVVRYYRRFFGKASR